MKFTRCLHPVIGKICLYLDLEGLDIFGDIPDEERRVLEEFLYFRITTYEALKPKIPEDIFTAIVRPVNKLFADMDEASRKIMAVMLVDIHGVALEQLNNTTYSTAQGAIRAVSEYVANYLNNVDATINLHQRIVDVVNNDIIIPDFSNLGNRPQDSKDKTFTSDEVQLVSEIVVMCKLLMPIFGVMIESTKKKVDTHMKELYVMMTLSGYLNKYYATIMAKLKDYVTNIIQQNYSDNIAYTFKGMSSGIVDEMTFSSLLVRRFVGVNLYQKDCNLMTYIIAFVRSSTANIGGRGSIESITKPSEFGTGGDEGNTSMLEAESIRSIATADLPSLIEISAEHTVRQFIDLYELDTDLYDSIVKYYSFNMLSINPVAIYLITLIFGRSLGGAYNVNLLTYESACRLVIVLQLLLIKLEAYDLVPLVTSERSITVKDVMTPVDNMIHANWKDSIEYIKLNKRFPHVIDGITWDSGLKVIVTYLTKYVHIVKCAPGVLELIGTTPAYNDTVFQYDDGIIKSICRIIIMFTTIYVANNPEEK